MRNISDASCKENRTHILCSVVLFLFFQQSCRLSENGAEYGGAGQTTDNNIIWRALCMPDHQGQKHPPSTQYLLLFYGNDAFANAP
jgi:hypothetical protein